MNLSFGKIAYNMLNIRMMNTCYDSVIPEVAFAVNTWLIKINSDSLGVVAWED